MKLNRFEFLLMNNPVRAFVQERYEVRVLRRMTSIANIDRALEIGCGNGHGAKLIRKYFGPRLIDAIDLDEKMIEIAKRTNGDPSIRFQVMDASRLDFPDNTFDAIFDFGIIHHIPNWRDCIAEMNRVLKAGGEAILVDLTRDTFQALPGRIWKVFLDHPYDKMFSKTEFVEGLVAGGFKVESFHEYYLLRLIKHFSLVARKQYAS
jgi:ubiquinone/menaquinone biosynthesis C-methylase UbiE